MLPLVGLAAGFSTGCGDDSALVAEVSPPVIQSSPSPVVVIPPAQPAGRAYALVSNVQNGFSQLQVFTGTNRSTTTLSPTVTLNLPFVATSVRHDSVRDRLYIVGGGTGQNQILAFSGASTISNLTNPTQIVQVGATGPCYLAIDPSRDLLYVGNSGGALGRLTAASQASNTTTVSLVQSSSNGAPLQQLTGLGSAPSFDQLIATASTALPPIPITSLPIYTGASQLDLTAASTLVTPPGLINAYDAKGGDGGRLLVLDSGNQLQTSGSALARVMRYDSTNNFGTAANLVLSVPGANSINYDSVQNILYVPNANGTVAGFSQFSVLSGTPTTSPTFTLQTSPVGSVPDVAVDPNR